MPNSDKSGARSSHSWREIWGSLRFRLMYWNTATVLLIVIVALLSVREGLRITLEYETSKQLQEDAEEARQLFERLYPEDLASVKSELNLKADTHTHRGYFARIYDKDLNEIWCTRGAPERTIPKSYLKQLNRTFSFQDIRFIHVRPRLNDHHGYMLRIATSFSKLEGDIHRLTNLLVLIGGIMLVISPIGGYLLAGRATQPLAGIIRMTQRWQPQDKVQARLPLRGTNDELDRLSQTINDLLDRISNYIEQNREFTANAAHELRSPLAALQSAIEVALNSVRSPQEYHELLGDLLEECGQLRTLVNQMLLLAETDAGQFTSVALPVNLEPLVRRAVDMFQGVAETRNIRLLLACEQVPTVLGDAQRLRQVINNLVDNAIKYSADGTTISCSLRADADRTHVLFRVEDEGIGISPEELPHIFERFFRSDQARHRDAGLRGSGLGLCICEAIVTAHAGEIQVESELGQGSIFTLVLPAEHARPANSELPAAETARTLGVP